MPRLPTRSRSNWTLEIAARTSARARKIMHQGLHSAPASTQPAAEDHPLAWQTWSHAAVSAGAEMPFSGRVMELQPRPWIDPAGTSGLVAATSPAPKVRAYCGSMGQQAPSV